MCCCAQKQPRPLAGRPHSPLVTVGTVPTAPLRHVSHSFVYQTMPGTEETTVGCSETERCTPPGILLTVTRRAGIATAETEMNTMYNVPLPHIFNYLFEGSKRPPNPTQPTSASSFISNLSGRQPPAIAVDRAFERARFGTTPDKNTFVLPSCATAPTIVTSAVIEPTGPGSYVAVMGPVPTVSAGRNVRIGIYRYYARTAAGGDFTSQLDRLNKNNTSSVACRGLRPRPVPPPQ